MFFNCGNLTLCSSESTLAALRSNASTHQFLGVTTHVLDAKQCRELVPELDISDRPFYPIVGGVYHPPGGTIRHDAVVWGLAKGASRLGVHIHQLTEVRAIKVENSRVVGVETNQGFIHTPRVLNAAGAYSPLIAAMVGMKLPVNVLILQALVSQPLKPFLDVMVSHSEQSRLYEPEFARGDRHWGHDGPVAELCQ